MKLTLIGGGGVRSPLFVMTLLRWQQRIGVNELCLMDIDERKLELFGGCAANWSTAPAIPSPSLPPPTRARR